MRIFSIFSQKFKSPVFVIFMAKNLSSNCCHRLRRVNVRYQCEISLKLYFDLHSLYSYHTWKSLLWTLIIILTSRDSSNYYTFAHPLAWASKTNRCLLPAMKSDPRSIFMFISNGSAHGHLITFQFTHSIRKRHMRA